MQIDYVICPICCRNYPIKSKRGEFQDKKWDGMTIYIRDCPGGKKPAPYISDEKQKPGWLPGPGFHIIEKLNWQEASSREEYKNLIDNIKDRFTENIKIIFSKPEVQKILESMD